MPNRLIREGFLDSEAINRLSDPSECFYHRLLLAADDAGRFDGRLEIIRARLFPLDSSRRASDVEKMLSDCSKENLVRSYEFKGKPFLQIAKWQRCSNAKVSKYPDRNGKYVIEFVDLETRDGQKEYVSSSLDPIGIPSVSHADPIKVVPPPIYGDGDDCTETETKTGAVSPSALVFPQKFSADESFKEAWRKWEECRRGLKKPKNWNLMFQEQINWLEQYAVPDAIEVMLQSIRNGWQGLFQLKKEGNREPSKVELKITKEAKERQLQGIKNRGHENPLGQTTYATDKDREDAKQLKVEIKEIERKLAA